jgi:hypothetical protein
MEQILETMEDIKQNIKDDEYKKIMDGLQILYYKTEYKGKATAIETQKYINLINWLDANLLYREFEYVKKKDLINYIITNYYNDVYFNNIGFVKRVLSIHLTNKRNTQDYYYGVYLRYNI